MYLLNMTKAWNKLGNRHANKLAALLKSFALPMYTCSCQQKSDNNTENSLITCNNALETW